jgi:hypothetical protein
MILRIGLQRNSVWGLLLGSYIYIYMYRYLSLSLYICVHVCTYIFNNPGQGPEDSEGAASLGFQVTRVSCPLEPWAFFGPGSSGLYAHLGLVPTWARTHCGAGHFGLGPIHPWPMLACAKVSPGPTPAWAQVHAGLAPLGPSEHLLLVHLGPLGPIWAQAHLDLDPTDYASLAN